RHTRWPRDWSSDVCSSDLLALDGDRGFHLFPPLHISKCNTTATVCTSSQGVSPSVLHPSRLVQGLLSVDRLRSPRAMISPTLRRSEERRVGTGCRSRW